MAASAAALVPATFIASPAHAADIPNLTITPSNNWEGGRVAFTVAYTGTGSSGVVTFTTADDTATGGTDYTATPTVGTGTGNTYTFPGTTAGGTNTITVYVQTTAHAAGHADADSGDETFNLVATDSESTPNVTTSADATIWDWDTTKTYTLTGPGSVAETATTTGTGSSAVTTQATATVSATLSSTLTHDLVIPVQTVDGTATAGTDTGRDYTALPSSATITIAAGLTSGSTTVTLYDDNIDEDSQNFSVTAIAANAPGGSVGYPTGGGSVSVSITDDDAQPTVSIANAGAVDEGGTLGFPVTLSNPTQRTASVRFDTASGEATSTSTGATSGTDFTAVTNRTLTFPSNATSTTVLVATTGSDSTVEGPENVKATLSSASNLTLATPSTVTGLINDTDAAPTAYYVLGGTETAANAASANSLALAEGAVNVKTDTYIWIKLASTSTIPVKLDYTISGGTATNGTDYVAAAGTVTIEAGQTLGKIPISIIGDSLYETPSETVVLTVTSSNNSVASGSLGEKTFTLTDDDTQPTFTVGDVSVYEGAASSTTQAKVPVTLSAPTNADVTFTASLSTAGLTYTLDDTGVLSGDNDYDSPSPLTATVKAGQTTGEFILPINGDAVFEKDEQIKVTLATTSANVNNTAVGSAVGLVTVKNDDDAPKITFTGTSGSEGTLIRVAGKVEGVSQLPYDVSFTVAGSGTDAATASTDFDVPTIASLSVARGETGTTFVDTTPSLTALADVYLQPDNIDEPTETFTVTATESTTTPIGFATSSGVYKINDDPGDLPPSAAIRDETIKEPEGSVDVRIDLSQNGEATSTTQTINIPWTTVDGTAKAGQDYKASSGTLSVTPGTMTAKVNVEILNDKLKESDENFYVKLGTPTPTGAAVTRTTGEVTIESEDVASPVTPTLTATGPSKGVGAAKFSGTASPNTTVELWGAPLPEKDPANFTYLAEVTSDDDGWFEFEPRSVATGYSFVARSQEINSTVETIKVTQYPSFSASSPKKGKLSVSVAGNPKAADKAVTVQRYTGGRWVTVGKGTTSSTGAFKKTYSFKSKTKLTLRAMLAGDTAMGINSGYSAQRKVTIK